MALSIGLTLSAWHFNIGDIRDNDKNNADSIVTDGSGIQLGQAIPLCEKQLKRRVPNLLEKYFDSNSSRYDSDQDVHLIFYQVISGSKQNKNSSHVVCTVDAKTGRLENFELISATRSKIM